jgi:ribonuclease HI
VILKALKYIHLKEEEKTVLVYTDSRITLQSLQNQKRHTHLIDQIRNKFLDMEQHEWKVDFSWIKAHVLCVFGVCVYSYQFFEAAVLIR